MINWFRQVAIWKFRLQHGYSWFSAPVIIFLATDLVQRKILEWWSLSVSYAVIFFGCMLMLLCWGWFDSTFLLGWEQSYVWEQNHSFKQLKKDMEEKK